MHDCKKLRDEIWEAVEAGKVPDDLLNLIGDCSICRNELVKAQSAMQGFAAFSTVDAPDCASAVMNRIDAHSGRGRAVWGYALGLVMVLVVLTVITVMHRSGTQNPAGTMAKDDVHQPAHPKQIQQNSKPFKQQIAVDNPTLPKEHKKHSEVCRIARIERVKPKSTSQHERETQELPKVDVPAVDPVDTPAQDEPTIAIIVMDDTVDQSEQSGEALDYGYIQTNPTTGDVTQCSVKKSGESVEIYMKIEPGAKEIPGEGRLDHEDANNV